jgi:hypothetical protein
MPRTKIIREKEHVENPTVNWAHANGCKLTYKMATIYARSWPDQLFLIPGGRPLFIEFKKPGEVPTEKQAHRIKQLRDLGYDVEVCDSKEQGIACVGAAMEAARLHASRRKVAPGARRRGAVP